MNKLKGLLREKGLNQQQLAARIGMSEQSLNAKLNGRSVFTVPEAPKICEILSIQNPGDIFFAS